jgi:flagellar biosynthesis/type III secretory pathway protein FliH
VKASKGVLSWTDEELAEHGRTKKWPEREVPDPPEPSPLPPHLEQEAAELGAAIRGYWRADGKLEGFREGRKQGRHKGRSEARSLSAKRAGKALGKKRRAKAKVWKKWVADRAPSVRAEHPGSTQEDLADSLIRQALAERVEVPERKTVVVHLSRLQQDGILLPRARS